MGGDGDEVYIPALRTAGEYLLVEVELVVAVVLVEAVEVLYVAGVGVGVGEGEFHAVLLRPEGELEHAL